jgi:hypothetical protein
MVDDIRWWMTLKPFFGSLHSQWSFLESFCFWVHCIPNNRSSCIWLSNPLGSFFYHGLFSLDYHFLYQTKDKNASTARTHHPHKQIWGGGGGAWFVPIPLVVGCLICSRSPIGLSSLEVSSFARTWVLPSCTFFLSLSRGCFVFIDDWQVFTNSINHLGPKGLNPSI